MARFYLPAMAMLAAGSHAAAQEQTAPLAQPVDTTLVGGLVEPVCSAEAKASVALISLDATSAQDVTNVVYTCNSPGGFRRTISSEEGGILRRANQGIPYLVSHTGAGALAFTRISLATPRVDTVPAVAGLEFGLTETLQVSIPAVPPALLAGTYADTITIEITPN